MNNEKPLAMPVVVIDANSMKLLQMIKCAADKYKRQQKFFFIQLLVCQFLKVFNV